MTKSFHQMAAAWVFGIAFVAFLMAAFWLSDDQIAQWKQPIPAFVASLLAGIFAFFITGSIRLVAEATVSQGRKLSIQAASGTAMFVIVFIGWSRLVPNA